MKVTFCILNYYEDWLIVRAIAQVYDYVDEILIGDSSRGKDLTLRVAGGLPKCRVISPGPQFDEGAGFDWAEWRNYVQSYATGDWILWQDPDEIYPLRFLKRMKEFLAKTDKEAIGLIRVAHEDHKRIIVRNKEVKIRLWKRSNHIRWVGAIHESPMGFRTHEVWNIEYAHDINWLPSFSQRIYKLKKRVRRGNEIERLRKEDLEPYEKFFPDKGEEEAFESRE